MLNIGLVLEGGGLRGVYTAGVLDAFLDNNIYFNYCIGVSAGACNAVSYISKQRGRNVDIDLNYINDKRYFSFHNLVTTGNAFGAKMMFDTLPHELLPFDYDTFNKSNCKLVVTATDMTEGVPSYYTIKDLRHEYDLIQASSSLPFLAKPVIYDGKKLMDGGMCDSIPIKRAEADGNEKNVIVLTQHWGYQKSKSKLGRLAKIKYKHYPKFVELLENRHEMYNNTLKYVDKQVKNEKAFVICPSVPLNMSRFEKDTEVLKRVYDLGYADTQNKLTDLIKFLG